MIDIIKYLDFIIDNNITQQQYTFLYLLWYKDIDSKEVVRVAEKYYKRIEMRTLLGADQKEDLIIKGFLVKLDENDKLSSYELTDKFLSILIDPLEAAIEFYELYPPFSVGDKGGSFTLKAWDIEEFRKVYAKRINHSLDEHNEVMKDLRYGINKGLVKVKIENFVKAEMWKQLRPLRKKHGVTTSNESKIYNKDI